MIPQSYNVDMSCRPVLSFGIALAAILAFAQTLTARQEMARSNLKMVTTGLLMYEADFDDVSPYPQETKSMFAVIAPYVKSRKFFDSLNPGSRILFNMSLGGVEVTHITRPGQTIAFYDEKPWPDGTHLVSFADGKAEFLKGAQWKTVEKTLHLKLKRSAKPLPRDYYKKLPYSFAVAEH